MVLTGSYNNDNRRDFGTLNLLISCIMITSFRRVSFLASFLPTSSFLIKSLTIILKLIGITPAFLQMKTLRVKDSLNINEIGELENTLTRNYVREKWSILLWSLWNSIDKITSFLWTSSRRMQIDANLLNKFIKMRFI